VTKGLSYLVTNDPGSGSDKNRKAEAYGVSVIDEAAFLGLIGRA
jgi:DNA ligase (NAD+)